MCFPNPVRFFTIMLRCCTVLYHDMLMLCFPLVYFLPINLNLNVLPY